ncbi:RNA polymerase sigma-70 factor, ECF subfamily [Prevotella sp. kh1p2]|nr:RNA polymerase sigma-70 factor, ECF subfamily [Prevotella sp. kh1p2]
MQAFEKLFLKYHGKVLRFVTMFIGDEDEAKDVAQDIFTHLWQKRQSMGNIQNLDNYFYITARNAALRSIRHHIIIERLNNQHTEIADVPELDTPEFTSRLEACIREAIDQMPGQRRRIFEMSRYENMSHQEIADKLNISKRTVDKHISLALADIRKITITLALAFINAL